VTSAWESSTSSPGSHPGHAYQGLRALFDSEGARDYLGEEVSMAQHMLQTGAAARRAGAHPELVVAAVVHDVGHFAGLSGRDLMRGSDNHHDEVAAAWLSGWFGQGVTEPVRLHVLAKRYLCAVDPSYYERLSTASKFTLEVQGGPMSPQEVEAFSRHPYSDDAVELRRCDDLGKDPRVGQLSLQEFRADIEAVDLTLNRPTPG
jgi:phosphonate degradation associated HDIG domain protein